MINDLTILIFKNNIEFVQAYIQANPNSLGFWYAAGLSSYTLLNEIVHFEKILIEEQIATDFQNDYKAQLVGIDISIFKSKDAGKISPRFSFYASNDTHVYLFKNILNSLNPKDFALYVGVNENAESAALNNGLITSGGIKECINDKNISSLLILGNDWGRRELELNAEYLYSKKHTICIQESILDLNESDGRLRNCSMPVFQGLNSLKNIRLRGLICAVIGNPRFENLEIHPPAKFQKVFINVNFTYGIFEEVRESWVSQILEGCKTLNIDYIISQHPRDNGDFSRFNLLKSHPGIVHETIISSTVVVSRFSALLLEAVALGRPAIYYNPHGETMDYKFEADNETLFVARNPIELLKCLEIVTSIDYQFSMKSKVLNLHLGNSTEGKASEYISVFLRSIFDADSVKRVSIFKLFMLKLKVIKSAIFEKGV